MVGVNVVGGVDRTMAGRMALSVVQPLSTTFTCQSLFFGVPPASDDGGAFEGDFATMPVKEYLTPGITQGGHQEELVGEAGETVS